MGGKKSRLSKFTEAVRLFVLAFARPFLLSFSLSFSGVAANSLSISLFKTGQRSARAHRQRRAEDEKSQLGRHVQ